MTKDEGDDGVNLGRFLADAGTLIGGGIADIRAGGPARRTAEIAQSSLGQEKQCVGILLRADLKADGGAGGRIVIDRNIIDAQAP